MSNSERARAPKSNLSNAAVGTFLLANAFVWYLTTFKFLQDAISSKGYSYDAAQLIIGLNLLAFVLSAFFAIFLVNRFTNRKKWLQYWILVGLLISALFALTSLLDFTTLLLLGLTVGTYFGFGMPMVAGFFAVCTEPKNRAKFGGAVILLLVISFPLLTIIGASSTYLAPMVLAIWLAIGLILLIYRGTESKIEPKNKISYRSVFGNRSFLLYLIPWLMFSLINDLTSKVIANSFEGFPALFAQNYVIFTNVIAGICAIIFGFLADKKGRKRLALVGFVLLGLGYAVLGLFPESYSSAWFYACADGIAWGAFTMLFITTLWGDIAQGFNAEKYYFIGVLPYLFSNFAGDSMAAYLAQNNFISEQTVFSFAAFFLFSATLPLFFAPETLPEKVLKDMDLISYVDKAKKKVQETAKKASKEKESHPEENNSLPAERDSSYEEAKKLAEK
jgi:MFS family permease